MSDLTLMHCFVVFILNVAQFHHFHVIKNLKNQEKNLNISHNILSNFQSSLFPFTLHHPLFISSSSFPINPVNLTHLTFQNWSSIRFGSLFRHFLWFYDVMAQRSVWKKRVWTQQHQPVAPSRNLRRPIFSSCQMFREHQLASVNHFKHFKIPSTVVNYFFPSELLMALEIMSLYWDLIECKQTCHGLCSWGCSPALRESWTGPSGKTSVVGTIRQKNLIKIARAWLLWWSSEF